MRSKIAALLMVCTLSACAGTDYSRPCNKLAESVSRVEALDKKTAALAQSFLDSCNGNEECVNAVISAFLPVQVLIQNTYRFTESLQRGGVCSEETVAVVEETVNKIAEIYDAYSK